MFSVMGFMVSISCGSLEFTVNAYIKYKDKIPLGMWRSIFHYVAVSFKFTDIAISNDTMG